MRFSQNYLVASFLFNPFLIGYIKNIICLQKTRQYCEMVESSNTANSANLSDCFEGSRGVCGGYNKSDD